MELVEARMRKYVISLISEELTKIYQTTNNADESVAISVEDVLVHLFEEEVHHRGELIALLWQMGVEHPLTGWKNM